MEEKNRTALAVPGIVTAAILVGSFLAISIIQYVRGQNKATSHSTTGSGNTTSHNATSLGAAAGNATTDAGNKTSGGSQGGKK